VDPLNPEIHTQTIENRWGLIKNLMRKRGKISRISFPEKIKEIVWRIRNNQTIQDQLLKVLSAYINS